jgi:5-methylthioadenosine/S-adenosylhomocysteine deaminase
LAVVTTLVRNGIVLTMNRTLDIVTGDVLIEQGRITAVGDVAAPRVNRVIDAHGGYVLPGFIQTHVHLCQTLFRGYADDLALLDWLKRRIWPMEAAHTASSLAAAARLAAAELLLGGTTTVLTMETVHDTDAVFEALEPMGIRAVVGKCMMDADREAPARLLERTQASLDASLALAQRWHGRANGRLRAAFAPRFAPSCSRELLEAVAVLSAERDVLIHTHASENLDEIALVRQLTGTSNIHYFNQLGLASRRLCVAHCVWVDDSEQEVLAAQQVNVLHCPGSNLKLGSGIAPVAAMRRRGISLSLGADGGACNNELDMFKEMRLAAGLQAAAHGAGTLTAADVLTMATRGGARALGLERELGSIEVGKRADLIVVDRDRPHIAASPDAMAAIVYAARPSDVRTTIIDGEIVVNDFALLTGDIATVIAEARAEAHALAARAFG